MLCVCLQRCVDTFRSQQENLCGQGNDPRASTCVPAERSGGKMQRKEEKTGQRMSEETLSLPRSITHLNGRPEPVGCMFSVCLFYRCEDQENPRYPRFSTGSRAETSCKLWSAAYGHLWRERSVLPMFSSSHAKIF